MLLAGLSGLLSDGHGIYDELFRMRKFQTLMGNNLYWGTLMFGIDQAHFQGESALDATQEKGGSRISLACRPVRTGRISKTGRQADVRYPLIPLPVRYDA